MEYISFVISFEPYRIQVVDCPPPWDSYPYGCFDNPTPGQPDDTIDFFQIPYIDGYSFYYDHIEMYLTGGIYDNTHINSAQFQDSPGAGIYENNTGWGYYYIAITQLGITDDTNISFTLSSPEMMNMTNIPTPTVVNSISDGGNYRIFGNTDYPSGVFTIAFGCTDVDACNYDPNATIDSGCEYEEDCFGECGGDASVTCCNSGIEECCSLENQQDTDCTGTCGGLSICDTGGNDCDPSDCCLEDDLDCSYNCYGTFIIDECGKCGGDAFAGDPGELGQYQSNGWCSDPEHENFGLCYDMDCNGDCFGEAYTVNCYVDNDGDEYGTGESFLLCTGGGTDYDGGTCRIDENCINLPPVSQITGNQIGEVYSSMNYSNDLEGGHPQYESWPIVEGIGSPYTYSLWFRIKDDWDPDIDHIGLGLVRRLYIRDGWVRIENVGPGGGEMTVSPELPETFDPWIRDMGSEYGFNFIHGVPLEDIRNFWTHFVFVVDNTSTSECVTEEPEIDEMHGEVWTGENSWDMCKDECVGILGAGECMYQPSVSFKVYLNGNESNTETENWEKTWMDFEDLRSVMSTGIDFDEFGAWNRADVYNPNTGEFNPDIEPLHYWYNGQHPKDSINDPDIGIMINNVTVDGAWINRALDGEYSNDCGQYIDHNASEGPYYQEWREWLPCYQGVLELVDVDEDDIIKLGGENPYLEEDTRLYLDDSTQNVLSVWSNGNNTYDDIQLLSDNLLYQQGYKLTFEARAGDNISDVRYVFLQNMTEMFIGWINADEWTEFGMYFFVRNGVSGESLVDSLPYTTDSLFLGASAYEDNFWTSPDPSGETYSVENGYCDEWFWDQDNQVLVDEETCLEFEYTWIPGCNENVQSHRCGIPQNICQDWQHYDPETGVTAHCNDYFDGEILGSAELCNDFCWSGDFTDALNNTYYQGQCHQLTCFFQNNAYFNPSQQVWFRNIKIEHLPGRIFMHRHSLSTGIVTQIANLNHYHGDFYETNIFEQCYSNNTGDVDDEYYCLSNTFDDCGNCDGTCESGSYGTCIGTEEILLDCTGLCGGDAVISNQGACNGICVDGNTGLTCIQDCADTWYVYDGDDDAALNVLDSCGNCYGPNTDCDGSPCTEDYAIDCAGECTCDVNSENCENNLDGVNGCCDLTSETDCNNTCGTELGAPIQGDNYGYTVCDDGVCCNTPGGVLCDECGLCGGSGTITYFYDGDNDGVPCYTNSVDECAIDQPGNYYLPAVAACSPNPDCSTVNDCNNKCTSILNAYFTCDGGTCYVWEDGVENCSCYGNVFCDSVCCDDVEAVCDFENNCCSGTLSNCLVCDGVDSQPLDGICDCDGNPDGGAEINDCGICTTDPAEGKDCNGVCETDIDFTYDFQWITDNPYNFTLTSLDGTNPTLAQDLIPLCLGSGCSVNDIAPGVEGYICVCDMYTSPAINLTVNEPTEEIHELINGLPPVQFFGIKQTATSMHRIEFMYPLGGFGSHPISLFNYCDETNGGACDRPWDPSENRPGNVSIQSANAYLDTCDECCWGTDTSVCSYWDDDHTFGGEYDCTQTCGGIAVIDDCDICDGNNAGNLGCGCGTVSPVPTEYFTDHDGDGFGCSTTGQYYCLDHGEYTSGGAAPLYDILSDTNNCGCDTEGNCGVGYGDQPCLTTDDSDTECVCPNICSEAWEDGSNSCIDNCNTCRGFQPNPYDNWNTGCSGCIDSTALNCGVHTNNCTYLLEDPSNWGFYDNQYDCCTYTSMTVTTSVDESTILANGGNWVYIQWNIDNGPASWTNDIYLIKDDGDPQDFPLGYQDLPSLSEMWWIPEPTLYNEDSQLPGGLSYGDNFKIRVKTSYVNDCGQNVEVFNDSLTFTINLNGCTDPDHNIISNSVRPLNYNQFATLDDGTCNPVVELKDSNEPYLQDNGSYDSKDNINSKVSYKYLSSQLSLSYFFPQGNDGGGSVIQPTLEDVPCTSPYSGKYCKGNKDLRNLLTVDNFWDPIVLPEIGTDGQPTDWEINVIGDAVGFYDWDITLNVATGCMNGSACNYDSNAHVDDGTCYYSDQWCDNSCDSGAFLDDCDVCSGGITGHIPNSDIDECGICFGNNEDKDCNNICFGTAFIDDCGVCVDGDTEEYPSCFCANYNDHDSGPSALSNNSACSDWLDGGGPCGQGLLDDCQVCNGGNVNKDECNDCFGDGFIGDPGSSGQTGYCATFDNPNFGLCTNMDCAQVCFSGTNVVNSCGYCQGPQSNSEHFMTGFKTTNGTDVADYYVDYNKDCAGICIPDDCTDVSVDGCAYKDSCNICSNQSNSHYYKDCTGTCYGDPDPCMTVDGLNIPQFCGSASVGNRDTCGECQGEGHKTYCNDNDSDNLGNPADSESSCPSSALIDPHTSGYILNCGDSYPDYDCESNTLDSCYRCTVDSSNVAQDPGFYPTIDEYPSLFEGNGGSVPDMYSGLSCTGCADAKWGCLDNGTFHDNEDDCNLVCNSTCEQADNYLSQYLIQSGICSFNNMCGTAGAVNVATECTDGTYNCTGDCYFIPTLENITGTTTVLEDNSIVVNFDIEDLTTIDGQSVDYDNYDDNVDVYITSVMRRGGKLRKGGKIIKNK